jgi:hypothetical protein
MGPRASALTRTPAGSTPSVDRKPSGEPMNATACPSLMPSFFGNGAAE